MDARLRSLLLELERFGHQVDESSKSRRDKMLNITPDTGELLGILVGMIPNARVLEIGTSNGYSTLWLGDAARFTGGHVVTLEHSREKAAMAQRNIERAGLSDRISMHLADASDFLDDHTAAGVDLLFLDADRERYLDWWPHLNDVLAPGGLLVVDNAISHAQELESFFVVVRNDEQYRTCLAPVGNGEFLALKRR